MSDLFFFELKKLTENRVFIICCVFTLLMSAVFLYFQYSDVFYLSFDDETIISDVTKVSFSGKERIDRDKKIADKIDGIPLDNTYNQKYSEILMESFLPDKKGNISIEKSIVGSAVMNLDSNMQKLDVIITDVNERGEHVQYIPDNYWGESETPVFRYTEGWRMIMQMLPAFNQLVLLITIIICARSVSSEYSTGMISILLPTEHGKTKLITAKLLSALMVTVIIFVVMSLLCIVLFGTIWGFDNPQADIRVFSNGAYLQLGISMTCVELLLSELAVNFCSVIITVFVCMLISSFTRNSFVSVIVSFAVIFVPSLLQGVPNSSNIIKQILVLLPVNMSSIMAGDWKSLELPLDIHILIPLITLLVSSVSIFGTYTLIRRHKAAK